MKNYENQQKEDPSYKDVNAIIFNKSMSNFNDHISRLKDKLDQILSAQSLCIDEYGRVRSGMRYRYQLLIREAAEIQAKIIYLEYFR